MKSKAEVKTVKLITGQDEVNILKTFCSVEVLIFVVSRC